MIIKILIFFEIMSTSELFALRSKLLKNSLEDFKKMVREEKIVLDGNVSNLFLVVYDKDNLKKQMMQYLSFLADYDPEILNIEVPNHRRLLQQLCYTGRLEDIRELLNLFLTFKLSLKLYHIHRLIEFAFQGKNSQETAVSVIQQLLKFRKYFLEYDDQYEKYKESHFVCLHALEREMLLPALEILKNDVGKFDRDNKELFKLPTKINKKEAKTLESFVKMYLEKIKCSPYAKDISGRTFLDYLPKDIKASLQDYIASQQPKQQAKDQLRKSSENKVRSSMGQGQNLRQNNSETINEGSRQNLIININSKEDELSVQRQGYKVYENIINEKEKYYKYEKKQKKEGQEKQKRVGIMKSQELRYYLEEEIKNQVEAIKEENRLYQGHYNDLIHKLKQKLEAPLNIHLNVFGSFRTQLCLPESDIDIAVTSANQGQTASPRQLLEGIEVLLQSEEMNEYIQSVKFIKTATVPIIKVTCSQNYKRKKLDFTFQDDDHNGLESVKLIQSYIDEYPQLENLIFILKKFIYKSNLSAPYLGGISSYGLVLMIVAYIQQEYKTHDGEGHKLLSADLLIGFLKFYGFKMNYVMKSIQIFQKGKHSWQNYTGCLSRYNQPNGIIDVTPKLVIIDPLNDNNNVGRPTHKIKQIQMAFEIAYISIHTFRQCGRKRKCPSYRKLQKIEIEDIKYSQNIRPCCILNRMFNCTQKFIKE